MVFGGQDMFVLLMSKFLGLSTCRAYNRCSKVFVELSEKYMCYYPIYKTGY